MQTVTPTELKQNSSFAFNAAQKDGIVRIKSKSRPTMYLITEEEFKKIKGVK
jgi:PHD/YefM family antitoxin component YafN of YafNO toxin-antitoxin module